jgi:hypothetical protein
MLPLLFVSVLAAAEPDGCGSYLYQPSYCLDDEKRLPARPYQPQPGDIMLATDNKFFWTWTHILAGTGHPHHTGVVFQHPCGGMAILEGGPHDTIRIRVIDAQWNLREYEKYGPVWLRARKTPLTPEQSKCLTDFALQQDGKFFALGRLGQQLTIFRTRGPIRTSCVGRPRGPNRFSYFCSELALEALVAAGALDAATTRPSATYPRDIFKDASPNPFINKTIPWSCDWEPPALWTSCPGCCGTHPWKGSFRK